MTEMTKATKTVKLTVELEVPTERLTYGYKGVCIEVEKVIEINTEFSAFVTVNE